MARVRAVLARARLRRKLDPSSGFTLIEVLVAISLLAIVSTAAIAFSVTAGSSAATQERRQVATDVAIQAMEQVNAYVASTEAATGTSFLLAGRYQPLVAAAWARFSASPGVGQTYPGYDTTANSHSTPRVPLESTVTRNGTNYDVVTLIGWCYKQSAAGDCKTIPAVSVPPASPPAGWSNKLLRVTTIVTWTAGTQCSTIACSYQTITLIDATSDLEWNNG